MMRVEIYGDSLIDLADEVVEETRVPMLRKMRSASRLLADRVRQMLRSTGTGVSEPGQAPGMDTEELANSVRPIGTRVRGNVIRGGYEVGKEDDIEKVQSLEFGATGDDGRILAARPFMRPAEAQSEAAITKLAES